MSARLRLVSCTPPAGRPARLRRAMWSGPTWRLDRHGVQVAPPALRERYGKSFHPGPHDVPDWGNHL